jgi:hypothetical protein
MGKELDEDQIFEVSEMFMEADPEDTDSLNKGQIKAVIYKAVETGKFMQYLLKED